MSKMRTIRAGDLYRDRMGNTVEIISTRGLGIFPVIGLVRGRMYDNIREFRKDGRALMGTNISSLDLDLDTLQELNAPTLVERLFSNWKGR